jgi:TonB family protein
MLFRFLFILSFIFVCQFGYADEASDQAEFDVLYKTFTDLYANSEDIDPIIEVAEKLYKLSAKVHGEKSINYANVTYNLASLYDERGGTSATEDEKKAADLYKDYFEILDKNGAPQDKDYFSKMVVFISAESNAYKSDSKDKYVRKAIEIADNINLPNSTIANYELKFGLLKYTNMQVLKAEDLFESSLKRFQNEFGENHIKIAENLFWLGKISLAKNREETSEKQFLKALDIFQKEENDDANSLAQSTHAFLVQVYENLGKSDEATKHCRAIAVERQTDFDAYIDPLYRKPPEFPMLKSYEFSKVQKESVNVLLEFDVDENGITKNINVIKSSNEKFNQNSIEAAERFRFAPSVEDGKIVETKNVRNLIKFVALE